MSVMQVCQYNELRQCLIVANNSGAEIHLSTLSSDVAGTPGHGICVADCGTFQLTWHDHGELVIQEWYCECTAGPVLTWEWISSPQLGDWPLTGDSPPIKFVRPRVWPRPRAPRRYQCPCTRVYRPAVNDWLIKIGGIPSCSG